VPLHMQRQVIRSRESSITQLTVEWFIPRMLPFVPREFVTTSESPPTVVPTADVRLLPCVGPKVSLQVGGLGVLLPTPRVLTCVSGGLTLQDDHNLRMF